MQARTRWIGAAAAAVVVLAAAAGWWWQQGRLPAAREGGAGLLAGSDPNAPFIATDCVARLLDDSPALAVLFSQPLDRKQKLQTQLLVSDLGAAGAKADRQGKLLQGAWVIGDNPRIAYFPYIAPQRQFRIEVQAGVLAADGRKLAEPKRCEVASEAMSPSFYFASRGVVLPAQQNGGLPIVTLNVPEVDLQFLRVQADELPRFFERVAGARRSQEPAEEGEGDYESGSNPSLKGRVSSWDLDQLHASTKSVYAGRFKTEPAANKRRVTFLPVEEIKELQEPGVYVAVMSQPGRFAQDYQVTYFYVSDIGLQAQRHTSSLDAFATSLKSGEPLSGIQFELLDGDGRSLGKAAGDAQGHALFASVPDAATLLVARRAKEMSVIALREPGLDLSEFDVGGHPSRNTKLFVYAGRDLYRPGETFQASVLARNADGRAIAPQPLAATLKRPDGRTVLTATWTPSGQQPGYFQRAVALPADAQTGTWLLELRADPGAKRPDASFSFQVEEFLPERMKLDLTTPKPVLGRDDPFDVQVRGAYLFGAPAAGNRLLVSATTERLRFAQAQQWPGFIFGDVADDRLKKREEVPEQSLDEDGDATVTLPVAATGAHSPLLVRGSFSLLESGGRPVVRSIERAVWPARELLALRPLFDRDVAQENAIAEFELIRVNAQGQFVALPANVSVPVRLIREERRYYWRYDDQKGWHSGYVENDEPLEGGSVALTGARTKLRLPVGYGRYRVELDDPQTKLKLRYRFYAGWGAQDAESIGNRPDRVQLKLANAPLKAGDSAQLTITPPHDGHALVTVQGDKLLWSKRMAVSAQGTTLAIPIDAAWNRHDLYATVTAYRPGSAGDRVTPARSLGLVHLPLARDDRKLKLAIQAPPKVLPETTVPVKLRAEGLAGQPAWVTLSAVDVGILNITRFKTPDPADFFFGKHRFDAELADMYGKLIEKMDGQRGKLAYGGDARARDTQSMPKKVKLVDLFSGPVQLDAKGEATVTLAIPDFNGTLRLMAVAATAEKFAHAESETVSAAPLVAEMAMPRFIAPGDAATLALDVTNLTTEPQTVKVKLEAAEPVRIADGERQVVLKPQQRTTLRFAAEATDAYGLGRLRLKLASASGITIARESVLQVQPPAALEREVRRARLEPGNTLKLEPALLERYYRGSSALSVSVSNKPPLNVSRLVKGLLDYPYGCLEQTTSAAYPHLFIDEAGAQALGLAPRSRAERAAFVEGAIGRLAGMQKANGGYTLWGDGPYESWLSAYVTGFLTDAKQQGFNVPEAMLKRGQDWLLGELNQAPNRFPSLPASARASGPVPTFSGRDYELVRDSHKRFAELAHVGYMLAREQKAPLAMLRLLHDQYRDRARSPLPLVHLALALKLMGDANRAQVALDDALARPYGIQPRDFGWGYEWLGDYGSSPRDLALAYALLHRHEMPHARRENLLFDLAERVGGRQYYSTQERLALFLAARAAGGAADQPWRLQLKTGNDVQAIDSRTTEMRSFDAAALARGVSLSSQSDAALFVEIDAGGYPLKAPVPRSDVIELKRDWFDMTGKPAIGRSFAVGEMLIVRVQARSKQRIEDALIVDRIPAGFEVENLNLSQGPKAEEFTVGNVNVGEAMADARIKHREYRDDRYVAAARLDPNWLNVFYLLRVVTPGRYVVPGAFAEDMYRPELRGIGPLEPPITITDPRSAAVAAVAPASAASSGR
ncbi:alpha-2-macroglobulin family protein [Aquincola sp. S2]|uniref:Alpha-2-macroglobulin family protein n=1 Tax=Pseudaquabacterium terrae TaxID=2732868 RepID=A0ABX2ELB6_9BURK|nr:alpha-2-macroglobulin [Aquabacterium terrae]NRF69389.1 alpha-2-macroglobulin family protein [Aquabacterium terrae]